MMIISFHSRIHCLLHGTMLVLIASLSTFSSPLLATDVEEVDNKDSVNEIHVQKKSDDDIRQDIKRELMLDAFLEGSNVRVTVKQGVATLTGSVKNLTARAAAKADAFQGGALKVRDHLKLRDASRDSDGL